MAAVPIRWKRYGGLALGATAASTAALWIRLILAAVAAPGLEVGIWIAAVRLGLAALVLSPGWAGLARQRYHWKPLACSASAGLCLAVHFGAWISSLAYTSLTASTVLVTTTPLWIALLSWLLWRERPTGMGAVGIAMALVGGLALAALGGSGIATAPLLGNGLALVGAWAVTGYLILGRQAQAQGVTTPHHVLVAYSVAALALLPWPWLSGLAWVVHRAWVYGWLLGLALVPQLIGHSCLNWSLRWASPTLVSLTVLTEPVVATLLGYWVFQERPSGAMVAAALLVLLGVLLAILGRQPDR